MKMEAVSFSETETVPTSTWCNPNAGSTS